jgi:DNA-binding GntR family transcriptional regulator
MTTQADGAYEGLRARILTLELAPGERVSERGLEAELGASRTPVRSALFRLESEGLVRRDERGWSVAPLDLGELRQVEEFREAVETAALRLAVERAADADLDRLDALLDQQPEDPAGGVRWGEEFHTELGALSGNPLLADAIRLAMTTLSRTRWLEVTTAESRAAQQDAHRGIVAALRARDADLAIARTVDHARAGADHVEQLLRGDRARGLRVTGLAP